MAKSTAVKCHSSAKNGVLLGDADALPKGTVVETWIRVLANDKELFFRNDEQKQKTHVNSVPAGTVRVAVTPDA
jgi:hypothetical protein